MKEGSVLIKGTRGGLTVYLDPVADLPQIKNDLDIKINSNRQFFEGTKVNLTITGKDLSLEDRQEFLRFILEEVDIGSIEFKNLKDDVQRVESSESFEGFEGIEEGMTRYLRCTVRNGQRIFYEGNVVVIGDVNPGGEVIAGGNIMVMGTLRGMAHAGATGNGQAIVAAFSLQPTQLRIGSMIARPPEGETPKTSYPELAHIKEGRLEIEPYLPGRIK